MWGEKGAGSAQNLAEMVRYEDQGCVVCVSNSMRAGEGGIKRRSFSCDCLEILSKKVESNDIFQELDPSLLWIWQLHPNIYAMASVAACERPQPASDSPHFVSKSPNSTNVSAVRSNLFRGEWDATLKRHPSFF